MTDSTFIELALTKLRQRGIRTSDVAQLHIEILRTPTTIGVAYKVTGGGPELIKVAEYVIGKLVAEHGIPGPDAQMANQRNARI